MPDKGIWAAKRDIFMMLIQRLAQACSKAALRGEFLRPASDMCKHVAGGVRIGVEMSLERRSPERLSGNGAWRRIRTTDTRIFNPLLYQLSYPGADAASREAGL